MALLHAMLSDHLQGRPDHQRHGDQHPGGRAHRLPVSASGIGRRTPARAGSAADASAAAAGRPPGRRAGLSSSSRSRWRRSSWSLSLHCVLFYTAWGLRMRAVGENPQAADTVGIDVAPRALRERGHRRADRRAWAGAYFMLESVPSFEPLMTNGRGFIALAAMIFGSWTPFGAWAAALFFGFMLSAAEQPPVVRRAASPPASLACCPTSPPSWSWPAWSGARPPRQRMGCRIRVCSARSIKRNARRPVWVN